jgi:phospholipid/cholesterol/gamma-HCH transport system substrate-binding protein
MRGRFDKAVLVKVLAFTIGSILLTIGLGMKIANVGFFGDSVGYEAEFSNASGVFEGDAVKLAGVDVGRVTGTRIEDGKAVVDFEVDREVPVTEATTVGIRWRNVIGLRFLYLYPGTGGERLEEGARIPDDRTDEAGDIGELLNSLGPILQAIDPEKANAFLDSMNTALAGNEATVQGLITDGSTLAGQLGDMDEQIQSLISSSDRITGAYASQDDALGQIVDDLDALSGELSTMTGDINALVTNFAVVQQEMERLLRENRGNIEATLQDLNGVARTLALKRRGLETLLCSLPAGAEPYDMTSSWGEWFNVRIVEFTFKDEQGRTISDTTEGPNARQDQDTPPFSCGDEGPAHAGGADAGTTGGATPATPSGSLDPWLDSVIAGRQA